MSNRKRKVRVRKSALDDARERIKEEPIRTTEEDEDEARRRQDSRIVILARKREIVSRLKGEDADLKEQILDQWVADGPKHEAVDAETDTTVICTKVSPDPTRTLDTDALLYDLPETLVERISKTVVDHGALQEAIRAGDIPPELVKRHTTEKPRDPYIRLDRKANQ